MQYGFVNSHVPYTDVTATMCMVDYDTKSMDADVKGYQWHVIHSTAIRDSIANLVNNGLACNSNPSL